LHTYDFSIIKQKNKAAIATLIFIHYIYGFISGEDMIGIGGMPILIIILGENSN